MSDIIETEFVVVEEQPPVESTPEPVVLSPEELAEQARLAEEVRLAEEAAAEAEAALQAKADAVASQDLALIIDKYLSDKSELRDENDSFNIANGSIFRWEFKNIPQPSIEQLYELIEPVNAKLEQNKINTESQAFLDATDFKVLRHIRQKALGQELSLSEEEYLALEQQRSDAAAKIVR
jgi:hypothetical protein